MSLKYPQRSFFCLLAVSILLLLVSCGQINNNSAATNAVPENTFPTNQNEPSNISGQTKQKPLITPSIPATGLVVTQDFGNILAMDKHVPWTGNETVLDALQKTTSVETAYGGGFIRVINGIRSNYPVEKKDWFLYVNGMLSSSGAGNYMLYKGDVQHWDLRDWSVTGSIPAIIGDFPEPFLHGYGGSIRPTTIVYGDDYLKTAAEKLQSRMLQLGITNISLTEHQNLLPEDKENNNLIIIGTADFPPISELNAQYKRLGFPAFFSQNKVTVFNSSDNTQKEYASETGIIQATQNPWNPRGIGACQNVLWTITGNDKEAVLTATNFLSNDNLNLNNAFGIVISNGNPIKVP